MKILDGLRLPFGRRNRNASLFGDAKFVPVAQVLDLIGNNGVDVVVIGNEAFVPIAEALRLVAQSCAAPAVTTPNQD